MDVINTIINYYKANQAKFGEDYKGMVLEGSFTVLGVKEEIFEKNHYYVEMTAGWKTNFFVVS